MKKGFYIAISLVFMGFTACKQDPSFKVEGEISGAAGKQLHLEQMGLEGITSLDSVKIKEDGRFCFEASRPESPEFYRLRVDRKFINFSVDSTENLVIHADYDRFSVLAQFMLDTFDVNFGNRIMNQIQVFVPIYVACGGTAYKALDLMFARKVLRKLDGRFEENLKQNLTKLEKYVIEQFGQTEFSSTLSTIAKMKRKLS